MTRQGISTVARQEFKVRIRAGRWRWLLGIWFGILLLFTVLVTLATGTIDDGKAQDTGIVIYGALVLLVLGLALLVAPALAAQSVNGDRERGTLATLQVTRLTAGDIALGKLTAAWGTCLVFLLLTLPLVGFSMTRGGVTIGRVVVVTLVIAVLLGTVSAVSLCLSALLHRTTTSGVLAYLSVFLLTVGTLITFALITAVTTEKYTQVYDNTCPARAELTSQGVPAAEIDSILNSCQPGRQTYQSSRVRTDRTWWLLAPNPFVVVADAAPQIPAETAAERTAREARQQGGVYRTELRDVDPLGALGRSVRTLRERPSDSNSSAGLRIVSGQSPNRQAVWPWGLGANVLLGAGAVWLTTRRLRTPSRVLPRGQRVA